MARTINAILVGTCLTLMLSSLVTPASAAGGSGTGKVVMSDFHYVKKVH